MEEIREIERAEKAAAYYAQHGYSISGGSGKVREKYLIDPTAKELVDEITADGFEK